MEPLKLTDISTSGLNLIEASAGTGKTWTIAALYIRLLLERDMKPEEILVVTYTRAATSELKDRIRHRISNTLDLFKSNRLPSDELEAVIIERCKDRDQTIRLLTRALFSFDNSAIFTIHGFCQRALADNAFESGSMFDTDMIADQSSIVQETCDDFWRKFILIESDQFLSQLIAERYTPEKMLFKLKGHYQNNELKIIPDISNSDFTTIANSRAVVFKKAAVIWRSECNQIIELLKKPGLNQGSYKPQQIDKAVTVIDNWFCGPSYPACDKLSFFSAESLAKKTVKGAITPEHPFFAICRELLEICQIADDAFQKRIIYHQHALHEWLKKELPNRKHKANLRCYDDLLLDLHQALHGNKGMEMAICLRDRYKAALIDEFQDTDSLQWQIFQKMTVADADYPLYLIGDPKQAIYSFRGADIYAYLAAADSVEEEQRWTLETNRRSTSTLVSAVNELFNSAIDPFQSKGINFTPVNSGRHQEDQLLENGLPISSPLCFWIYPTGSAKAPVKSTVRKPVADAVAFEIKKLLSNNVVIKERSNERRLCAGDIAILVRTHSQAELINQALSASGIKSVQYGSTTIFETPEALDLLRLLKAIANPGRSGLLREAMLGGLFGLNANSLDKILHDDQLWDNWLERFKLLSDSFRSGGVVAMASFLLDQCGSRQCLLELSDGERRLTNLLHCVELTHQAALESGTGIERCITWLEEHIGSHQEDETTLLRLETDDEAVRIATIHSSKGLQYPVVFLPFAWDASSRQPDKVIFHDESRTLTLDLGSDDYSDNRQKSLQEQNAESMRLLYVALTRAEFRCYVVWGAISQADASPLYRLLHGNSAKEFKELNDEDIQADISKISQKATGISSILMPMDVTTCSNAQMKQDRPKLVCLEFKGKIEKNWRISSFSSIAGSQEKLHQPKDLDASESKTNNHQPEITSSSALLSIFNFPKGPEAGTCLHELFEKLDFSNSSCNSMEILLKNCLLRNGYDLCWTAVVQSMVMDVVSSNLSDVDSFFSLNQLKPGSWMTEMEFYLPLKILSSTTLKDLFINQLNHLQHGNFAETITSLRFQESKGMLTGFIDMVFVHKDRYFIIDWKSNHLGNSDKDYGQTQLKDSMNDHAYILQYHLYTLALNRFLMQKISDYDYEKHFGGVLYLFLRGISSKESYSGVYFDRPSQEFIIRANKYFLAEDSNKLNF